MPDCTVEASCSHPGMCLEQSTQESKEIARLGFEPRLSESESLVLPLHHQAMVISATAREESIWTCFAPGH